MTEAWFYHLQRQPLERVLPVLLERTLARGWKAVVQAGGEERLAALDDHLWTFSEESFLPHVTDKEADAALNPIVLTLSDENPNGAQVRFCVDGVGLPQETTGYERLMLIFDGNDDEALASARSEWKRAKDAGLSASYWQQDEQGKWDKKA
ncbi:MAG: DNA polymerase III subunit chi [Bosea sp. (in: a-proteobacteria)]